MVDKGVGARGLRREGVPLDRFAGCGISKDGLGTGNGDPTLGGVGKLPGRLCPDNDARWSVLDVVLALRCAWGPSLLSLARRNAS